ncbi:hypothetical protein [Arthrobacter sp. MMS18-M83]|uniref:hypothetical protein n=1 Tax=Arthrobacter sp. MMS18-M83 TaxID=2996261 RepID=UPI00227C8929|nr:hypothetical protein [Arthrobacter sp. MMS18-M83]WAH97474.1 hypothetical protein OW521_00760 [Arthrobacter sp. MMS18-M83]
MRGLLRHGIRYTKDTRWTKEHIQWLHRQNLGEPALQFTYQADVEQAELLAGHLWPGSRSTSPPRPRRHATPR